MESLINRIVPQTLTSSNAVLPTAAQEQDTLLTNTMNGILAAPPAGYVPNSIKLQPTVFVYDGAAWHIATVLTYNTVS